MLGKGTETYEERGKTKIWVYLFLDFRASAWQKSLKLEDRRLLALIVLFLFVWHSLLNHLSHKFCIRRDRGPTKASCSVWPDWLTVQSALWSEWGQKRCYAYVFKAQVLLVNSMGSLGKFSPSRCVCVCACVCMNMFLFFPEEAH